MVEFGSALRFYRRDVAAMRQKIISFVFARIPADGAALVFVNGGGTIIETVAYNPENPSREVPVNHALVERVFRSGGAMIIRCASPKLPRGLQRSEVDGLRRR